jgi:hypothetical protein
MTTTDLRPVETPADDFGSSRRWPLAFVSFVAGALLATLFMVAVDRDTPPPDTTIAPIQYGEEAAANWDVIGVVSGENLDVRGVPSLDGSVVGALPSHTVELESTGRIALNDGVLWREIKVPGATTGWVPAGYLIETTPSTPGVDLGIPAPALSMAERIVAAVQAEDLEALAVLAFEGDSTFTATFGGEVTNPTELVALWEQMGAEEIFAAINGLVGLPNWYETASQNADGATVAIFVTPRFMHEPSNAENRRLLEEALGFDYVESSVADGQYLGWRMGITAEGDWKFLVSGD